MVASSTKYRLPSGRLTTASPKFLKSPTHNIRKLRAWIRENALCEAREHRDEFNKPWIEDADPKCMHDGLAEAILFYLLNFQPPT